MKSWEEVGARHPLMLNLGGDRDCHPAPLYEDYVSVDLEPRGEWAVRHDLTEPIPLPDHSVDRILSEHVLEHIALEKLGGLLEECHRVLKINGLMRVAVPDCLHPKEIKYLNQGYDPRHTDHVNYFTHQSLCRLVAASPFPRYKLYNYWDDTGFREEPIDYSLGMVKRTSDNDPRCRRDSAPAKLTGWFRDAGFLVTRVFSGTKEPLSAQRGHRHRVTSLVIDLFKDGDA